MKEKENKKKRKRKKRIFQGQAYRHMERDGDGRR
jgi:hypothetical protein